MSMKLGHLNIVAAIFAALPGNPRSCSGEEEEEIWCPSQDIAGHPEDYAELCGDTRMDVQCLTTVPKNSNVIRNHEYLTEVSEYLTPPVEIPEMYYRFWKLENVPIGNLRYWTVPFHYGVPIVKPISEFRSDTEWPEESESKMSAYHCSSDVRGECIIDMLTAWSWTLRPIEDPVFADDYVYATKIIALRGNCPVGQGKHKVGDTWKGYGKLIRPEG